MLPWRARARLHARQYLVGGVPGSQARALSLARTRGSAETLGHARDGQSISLGRLRPTLPPPASPRPARLAPRRLMPAAALAPPAAAAAVARHRSCAEPRQTRT